jgi:hypothetical protein
MLYDILLLSLRPFWTRTQIVLKLLAFSAALQKHLEQKQPSIELPVAPMVSGVTGQTALVSPAGALIACLRPWQTLQRGLAEHSARFLSFRPWHKRSRRVRNTGKSRLGNFDMILHFADCSTKNKLFDNGLNTKTHRRPTTISLT